ncbi:MAG: hypothetical protein ACOYXB_14880 [Bacteroidota bacterium]
MKRVRLIFLLLWPFYMLTAQVPDWYLRFDQIMDNREYFTDYAWPQTILGARLNAGATFSRDSVHFLSAGLNYMYEYGGKLNGVPLTADLFYHYRGKHLKMWFGSFPRRDKLDYPLVLLNDTLNYYRPNIEGGLVRWEGEAGYLQAWADWTSRQTEVVKETFLAGMEGLVRKGIWLASGHIYMYHRASTVNNVTHEPIRDNGGGALFTGLDLSRNCPLDHLVLDGGIVGSYDRVRPDPYGFAWGGMLRLKAEYRFIGLQMVYYRGDPQVLAYGDTFYRSGNYLRSDIYFRLFRKFGLDARAGLSLHLAGGDLNNSQQLLISIPFL